MRVQIGPDTSSDPELLADYDLLLTDSLIRMGYHLIFGKVDPEDHHPHWNLMVEIDDDRPAIYIQEILDAGNLAKEIEELRPQQIIYDKFRSALKSPLNWPKYYWITLPSGTRKALRGYLIPGEPKQLGFLNPFPYYYFTGLRLRSRTIVCVLKKIHIKETPKFCKV